ncbi:hypothetical protein E2C01_012376 [Portunus trituberculatus]|uniref:Uncharacterized protein n=1 Tax=Portunus trituberculatus TaxID=210409 RepID=A0A5B7DDJ9_PORTR|nr:hypothetical protein [Portunus trituberculatus]
MECEWRALSLSHLEEWPSGIPKLSPYINFWITEGSKSRELQQRSTEKHATRQCKPSTSYQVLLRNCKGIKIHTGVTGAPGAPQPG